MKKVLILTLGGGRDSRLVVGDDFQSLSRQEKKQLVEKRLNDNIEYRYSAFNYCFSNSDEKGTESEFVAEALISKELPNIVFMLGTIRSSWIDFYRKYSSAETSQKAEDICDLFEATEMPRNDCLMDNAYLINRSERIEEVFNRSFKSTLFAKCPEDVVIKPVLLHYGINDEQLGENYKILSNVWQKLDPQELYEVAFDITHSFRSLPIYNLSLLDYLRQVADLNIDIDHVYYGNIEVSRELGYAPIVDLADLVKVMDLSRGVSEFRELGYSMTLIRNIPDKLKPLKDSLEEFYWAVQMNDVSGVCNAIKLILDQLEFVEEFSGRYVDLRNMIRGALRDILGGEPDSYREIRKSEQVYRLKQLFAKWHRDKNRYSNAAVSALESFRTFLCCYYLLEHHNILLTNNYNKNDYSDKNLKEAEGQFERRFNVAGKEAYAEVVSTLKTLRRFRNDAAHLSVTEEQGEGVSVEKAVKSINDMIGFLDRLYNDDTYRDSFLKIYRSDLISENSDLTKETGAQNTVAGNTSVFGKPNVNLSYNFKPKKIAIYVGKNTDINPNDYLNDPGIQLYCLQPEVFDAIFKRADSKPSEWATSAYMLSAYLQKQWVANQKVMLKWVPVYIDLQPEEAFFVAMMLAYDGAMKVFYTGTNGLTRIPMPYVEKEALTSIKPNLGIFDLKPDNRNKQIAEKKVVSIESIGLIPCKQ